MTIYTPAQIAAAHRLHDTCRDLTGCLRDEPQQTTQPDYEQRWQDWNASYGVAARLHDDAEAAYRREFPDTATRPHAHEVIDAVHAERVQVLRTHQPADWRWNPTVDTLTVTCACGAERTSEAPESENAAQERLFDDITIVASWILAPHVATELAHL